MPGRASSRTACPGEHRATAWHLVAPDGAPAFMQPAIHGKAHGKVLDAPDEIDVLVNSRNHDGKVGRRHALPDDWLLALVSAQVQSGYGGRGNQGVVRMNGGYASRAGFGLVPPGGPGARFLRDLRAHLAMREAVALDRSYKAEGGIGYLWLAPWRGDDQLSLADLDPYFVEVCRRFRLDSDASGRITCRAWNNESARVAGKEQKGHVGDLWTVVIEDKAGTKALTPDPSVLGYRRLVSVMFGSSGRDSEYRPAPLAKPLPGDPAHGMRFSARFLVRSEGKTDGYHERLVPYPVPAAAAFALDEGEPYADLAKAMVQEASEVGLRCLSVALTVLARDGEDVDFNDAGARTLKDRWIVSYHRRVDSVFFERLAGLSDRLAAGEPRDALVVAWTVELHGYARACLEDAFREATGRSVTRVKARARSGTALRNTFNKFKPAAAAVLWPSREAAGEPDAAFDAVDPALEEMDA